jgi:O-acetyl-ADP-ribose deacetylase (regulator of RNase III)
VWRGGGFREEGLIRSCYRNSLILAEESGLRSIAFPSISTGAYGFPLGRASQIAVETVREFLKKSGKIERVVFVCFSHADFQVYLNQLGNTVQEI